MVDNLAFSWSETLTLFLLINTNGYKFVFIHSCLSTLMQGHISGGLDPIPADIWQGAWYTLDRWLVIHRDNLQDNLHDRHLHTLMFILIDYL